MKSKAGRIVGTANIERETVDGEPAVRVTFGHWSGVCIFLILWLTGWSCGCYKLVVELVTKPVEFGKALCALPFFAGEIFVASMILLMIFGRTVITLRRDGGTKFTGVGRFGFTKELVFPVNGEICTDEVVRYRSKGGPYTVYRLIVKSKFNVDGPFVIYDSTDPGIIHTLCEAAKEVSVAAGMPSMAEKSTDEFAAEDSGMERRDYELLSGKPPKGISISRDFEGRIVVVLRRVRWVLALVLVLVMSVFITFFWHKFTDTPLLVKVGFGVAILFPFTQLLFALFGKRTLTLDHGNGTTFAGVGPIGQRRRFEYGASFAVKVATSGLWINNEQMNELVIAKPGGTPQRICASWPNDVKPYLVAILRHPGSAPAMIETA